MTLPSAVFLTTHLLALTLLLQALELLFVLRSPIFKTVWSFEIVKADLEKGLPLPATVVRILFGARGFQGIVSLQFAFALAALIAPQAGFFAALLLGHLLICMRFRGSYNGGSDMMTFVILTGVLLMTLGPDEKTQCLGCIYITIQAVFSYFKAGLAKVRERGWRDGHFLSTFLSQSLFADIRRLGVMLRFQPSFAKALTWLVLIFEMTLILALIFKPTVWLYFAAALLFHFVIYRAFGLNRFFWIWLCAWPSIIYLGGFAPV